MIRNKIIASYQKHTLHFKRPAGTSRGVLQTKDTYFLILERNGRKSVGECSPLKGLSIDDVPHYEEKLEWLCESLYNLKDDYPKELLEFPSIKFGLEQALIGLGCSSPFLFFPSKFTEGTDPININGLVWMGDKEFMKEQIAEKIRAGFTTIKMKIGAIQFKDEIALLQNIRKQFPAEKIEIRVDANGAFSPEEALEKLNQLSDLQIHSIEQPIKQGQWKSMSELCKKTPIPIALDEELIGIFNCEKKEELLQTIQPQYIILKPSLVGGFERSKEWIELAKKYNIGWWITSALESNIGLNVIAQWAYELNSKLPQGLGTGNLFLNNFDGPLEVVNGHLHYNPQKIMKFPFI